MRIMTINITNEELVKEVKSTYLSQKFLANCEFFKIEVIDGILELRSLIKKFKKFDKLSIMQKMKFVMFQ